MNNQDKLSDIEKLLASQTWKHKKLPSILQPQRKSIKVRSLKLIEKPRKSERIITQPCSDIKDPLIDNSCEVTSPVCRNQNPQNRLCNLAIPNFTQPAHKTAVSSRSESFDFQIPIFPKTHFAHSSMNLLIVPRFENLRNAHSGEVINEMKIYAGRIKKNSVKTQRKRFEYLENFNSIKHENVLKRRDTMYLNN